MRKIPRFQRKNHQRPHALARAIGRAALLYRKGHTLLDELARTRKNYQTESPLISQPGGVLGLFGIGRLRTMASSAGAIAASGKTRSTAPDRKAAAGMLPCSAVAGS